MSFSVGQGQNISWQQIDQGLELAKIKAHKSSIVGDERITVLRIDPENYDFQVFAASHLDKRSHTAKQWCEEEKLVACVNAGMFMMDGLRNVGYMKIGDHFNNSKFNKDNTIIAMGRKNESIPHVQIIDRTCQDWEALVDQYEYATQGIRMVDCQQKNRWSQQPRKWSMVVMGMDKQKRGLFIFCRSPYSVHDFIDMLLGFDLGLYNAMYLEGGPEASLYLKTKDCEIDLFGSYETGFYESDGNDRAWPIPNVIGIKRRIP